MKNVKNLITSLSTKTETVESPSQAIERQRKTNKIKNVVTAGAFVAGIVASTVIAVAAAKNMNENSDTED